VRFQKCSASLNEIVLFALLVVSRRSRDDACNIETRSYQVQTPSASLKEHQFGACLRQARVAVTSRKLLLLWAYHTILPAPSALSRLRCGHLLIHYVPSIPSISCLYAVRSAHNLLSIDLSCASACLPSSRPLLGMLRLETTLMYAVSSRRCVLNPSLPRD
jgi:hypothetical protein